MDVNPEDITKQAATHPVPRTWHDAYLQTAQFQGLLREYGDDYQAAVDAWVRGEVGDPRKGGNANPM